MYLIGVAHTTVDICATYLTGEFIRPHSELLGACCGALLNVDDWIITRSFCVFFCSRYSVIRPPSTDASHATLRVLRKFDVTNVIATSERQLYVRSNHLHANKTKENCCVFRPQTQTVKVVLVRKRKQNAMAVRCMLHLENRHVPFPMSSFLLKKIKYNSLSGISLTVNQFCFDDW